MGNTLYWVISFPFMVFLAVFGGSRLRQSRQKQLEKERQEIEELTRAGHEVRVEFEEFLKDFTAYIYNRPTRILPSVEPLPPRWRFWSRRYRIVLTVRVVTEEDNDRLEQMLHNYLTRYRAEAGHESYQFKILFPKVAAAKGEGKSCYLRITNAA